MRFLASHCASAPLLQLAISAERQLSLLCPIAAFRVAMLTYYLIQAIQLGLLGKIEDGAGVRSEM